MHFFSIVVGAFILAPFVSGCSDESCGAAPCDAGMHIAISDMPTIRHSLVLTITIDDVPTVCSSIHEDRFPAAEGGSGGEGGASSSPEEPAEIECEGPLARSIHFYQDDGSSFRIDASPESFRLELEIDGEPLLDEELHATYETLPATPGSCAVECNPANFDLVVDGG